MQITSSTSFISSTNGLTRANQPVNPDTVVRSVADTQYIGIDSKDRNLYPVIRFDLVTKATQFWFYDIGDEATRDADLVIAGSATSGGGNIFTEYGSTGEYTQSQTLNVSLVASTALLAGYSFFIPVYLSGNYTEFSFLKLASAFTGNFNFAIYEGDTTTGQPFLPKTRLWQSAEKNLTVAQELVQELISPSINFSSGWYFLGYTADAAFTFTGNPSNLGFIGINLSGVPAITNIARWFNNTGYSSSMPATWVAALSNSLAGNPPLLMQKKEL
jgi:hypothetical protein